MGDKRGIRIHHPFFIAQNVARGCRDYLTGVIDYEPWALSLAWKCYDMVGSQLIQLPFDGGVWDQDDLLMHLISMARKTWYTVKYKPDNKKKWNQDVAKFLAWIDDGTD